MAENSRSDIVFHDVFISWTGADREAKNQIVEHLQKNGIFCLESDSECCGDFTQWSREAVQKCTVFLLLLTPNALKSQWIPVELEEQKKLPNANNRLLPVCVSNAFYQQQPWDIKNYASACFLEDTDYLDKILSGVKGLLNQNMYRTFRLADQPDYIKLIPLYKTRNFENKSDDFSKLYIPRTLTCLDDKQQVLESGVLLTEDNINQDVIFLHGGAGSGKTRYVDQLKAQLSDKVLPITLSCSRLAQQKDMDLVGAMYEAFRQKCGCRGFYTRAHFESLLTDKRLLLILDGMDEIPTAAQTNIFCSNLQKIINAGQRTLDVTLLLTSRNADDYKRLNFDGRNKQFYRLDPLTEENIRQLSEKLFFLFGAPEKDQGFYLQVADLDAEIKTNPLLLSQLAIVYTQQDELPQTAVEIYDAIFSICLEQDKYTQVLNNGDLQPILSKGKLSRTLKAFARLRYESLSRGENWEIEELFCRVLEPEYGEDAQDLAEDLVEYLQNRALLVADEFYHKMFLEYFTAVSFYDSAFGFDRKCKDLPVVQELFTHYSDPYWATVIQLFLVKVDAMVDAQATRQLYGHLSGWCQDDFTLLFNTCRELLRHKVPAQNVLTDAILQRSADGSYPAYGPLFWYIPEYDLYENVVTALLDHIDDPDFPKMLALTRDVCFIFGQKNTVTEFLPQVDGVSLWKKANLTGVRGALCEIFCTGATDFAGGEDIYPRCFNVAEAKAFLQSDCGITGRMTTPFADELGLYAHDFVPVMGDYNIGFAALPYDIPYLEKKLNSHSCRKLRGLALSPTDAEQMAYMSFNSSHLDVCYIPENAILPELSCLLNDFALPDNLWYKSMPLRQFVFETGNVFQYIRYGLQGVKTIEPFQFAFCQGFTDLVIPKSVISIRYNAFQQCKNLRSVVFTDSDIRVEEDAFCNTGVQSIVFAEGMKKIGGFARCHALTFVDLPSSLTTIEQCAFAECTALESVALPEQIAAIESKAFADCQKLTAIVFTNPNLEIAEDAFQNSGLQSISFAEGMDNIGGFPECRALTTVTLPVSATTIISNAFAQCDALESVVLPEGLTDIGYAAFAGCTKLSEITIPGSVINLYQNAFADCTGLQQVNLSEGLRSIYHQCFAGCEALTQIHLPETVDVIAMDAFWGCVNLQSIYIPAGVSAINSNTFRNCRSLTQIHLPEGLTCIGKKAFYQCSSLTTVNIPNSVTEIGDEAFGCCPCLTALNLPAHLEEDRDYYTQSMEEEEIIVEETRPCHTLQICLRSFSAVESGECLILSDPVITKETVQDHLQNVDQLIVGEGFTELGSKVFENLPLLEKVHLPDSLQVIGAFAFHSNEALRFVRLPEGLVCIENSAFNGCIGLENFQIPSTVTRIGAGAFQMLLTPPAAIQLPAGLTCIEAFTFGFSNLKEITIPEGVRKIEEFAFWSCGKLTRVHMPTTMDKIERNAFYQCSSLLSICLPNGLSSIPADCFNSCSGLTEITVPEGVAEIGNFAFENCTQLISVTLPNSLRVIDSGAFAGCASITEVTIGKRFEDSLGDIFPDAKLEKVTFI